MALFNILGPLEVHSAGAPSRGDGVFQTTLLTALLVGRGKVHSAEALMGELWGLAIPDRPENALQAHISRLRAKLRRLEPERRVGRLALLPAEGYRLDVSDSELDAGVFMAGVQQLRGEVGVCPPARMAARVREALSLWRGPALGGIIGGPICQDGALAYEEARSCALEMCFDAQLALGNHRAIIAQLSELVTAQPAFRERYCGQLMVALYRSGRQTDALDVYRRAREHAMDTRRAGPSPALREFERAVLAQDPGLDSPRPHASPGSRPMAPSRVEVGAGPIQHSRALIRI